MSAALYVDFLGNLVHAGTAGFDATIVDQNGIQHLMPHTQVYPLTKGSLQVKNSTFTSIGTVRINPAAIYPGNAHITRSYTFRINIFATPGGTAEARLYNLTDGGVVSSTTLSTTASIPTDLSATLTVAGNIPNAVKTYEMQLRLSSPTTPSATDLAFCKSAEIFASWVYS